MKNFVRFGACGLLLAIAAPAFAGSDPETDQMICDLAGQCDPASPADSTAPAAAVGSHGPRGGETRGFTFKREAPTHMMVPPAVTAPPAGTQTASIATSRPVKPERVGASNLRLNFASGSAELNDADKARLAKLAQVLSLPALATRRTRIEGHTDASGSFRANTDLSRRRAQSVADYLVDSGVSASRLEVVGFGSTQPLPGLPADAPQNRRVMAVILN